MPPDVTVHHRGKVSLRSKYPTLSKNIQVPNICKQDIPPLIHYHVCYQFRILRNLRLTSKVDWKNIPSVFSRPQNSRSMLLSCIRPLALYVPLSFDNFSLSFPPPLYQVNTLSRSLSLITLDSIFKLHTKWCHGPASLPDAWIKKPNSLPLMSGEKLVSALSLKIELL